MSNNQKICSKIIKQNHILILQVAVAYALFVMKNNLTRKKENNNNEDDEKKENSSYEDEDKEKKLNLTTLFLNTFTVALRRRKGKQQMLLILAIISFTLFEAVFPVDDTLLYVHLKVSNPCSLRILVF